MTNLDYERWNKKYGKFYVTRYSAKTYRFVQVGKPHATIEGALAAACRADDRDGHWMSFVDIKKPN